MDFLVMGVAFGWFLLIGGIAMAIQWIFYGDVT